MLLIFYGVSASSVQTVGNPSFFSTVGASFAAGNLTQWTTGATVTLGSYWYPVTLPVGAYYYYKVSNAGSGHIGTVEPTWPTTVGATTTPDSNGVVWTCTGLAGASFGGGETPSQYYANGAPQALTFQYDGAGSGTYNNVISSGLRYGVLVQDLDPTVLVTGLELTFADITSLAFE